MGVPSRRTVDYGIDPFELHLFAAVIRHGTLPDARARASFPRVIRSLPARAVCQAQDRSNLSAFITFVQAATKSRTNFSLLSSCA